jgi:hypothetical protein
MGGTIHSSLPPKSGILNPNWCGAPKTELILRNFVPKMKNRSLPISSYIDTYCTGSHIQVIKISLLDAVFTYVCAQTTLRPPVINCRVADPATPVDSVHQQEDCVLVVVARAILEITSIRVHHRYQFASSYHGPQLLTSSWSYVIVRVYQRYHAAYFSVVGLLLYLAEYNMPHGRYHRVTGAMTLIAHSRVFYSIGLHITVSACPSALTVTSARS